MPSILMSKDLSYEDHSIVDPINNWKDFDSMDSMDEFIGDEVCNKCGREVSKCECKKFSILHRCTPNPHRIGK